MANERLRAALQQAELEPEQLADLIQVDAKTVHRWLSGRTPYPRHRNRIAKALGVTQHQLWPDTAPEPEAGGEPDTQEDRDAISAYLGLLHDDASDWRLMLREATDQIDLLDYTLTDLTNDPDTLNQLQTKAAGGCAIRILISHPESAHLTITEAERHPDRQIAQRPATADQVEQSLQLLRPLQAEHGLEFRTFVAERFNSILRFDDEMLVSLHLWGTPTSQAPLLHLNQQAHDELFTRFADHYDAIWNHAAQPLT